MNQESQASFMCKVPAKWVLAGEHSVLKGVPAVTLPQDEFSLVLKWIPKKNSPLTILPAEQSDLMFTLIETLKKIIPMEYQSKDYSGVLVLENSIPLRAGLGSSAALSVGLVRFLTRDLSENNNEFFYKKIQWASELENFFHGKSSGMDVAAVSCETPLVFNKLLDFKKLEINKTPKFTFHNTGEYASTLKCIEHVLDFEKNNPEESKKLHQKMLNASTSAEEGLLLYSSGHLEKGEESIAHSMELCLECFYGWGLITDSINQKILELKALKPRAVKLTGAGLGGFLVALWR